MGNAYGYKLRRNHSNAISAFSWKCLAAKFVTGGRENHVFWK